MGRFLIVALTVTTAALGFVLENTILLFIAGGFLAVSLLILFLLSSRRTQRRSRKESVDSANRTWEQELRALGLSEPRPKGGVLPPENAPKSERFAPEPKEDLNPEGAQNPELFPDENTLAPQYESDDEHVEEVGSEEIEDDDDMPPVLEIEDNAEIWQHHSPTAFKSFLRACWAAADVLSALIVIKEQDGSYSLLASQSHLKAIRNEGRFPADSLFSLAVPSRPMTTLETNDPYLRELPYYRTKTAVGSVGILPVQGPKELLYLVVDLRMNDQFFTQRQRTLLLDYAALLQTMLEHPQSEPVSRVVPTRRAIILQEMSFARNNNTPLILALAYRSDAEKIESGGGTAVAEAERNFRLFLEDHSDGHRLERFGDLMYGIFLNAEFEEAETWAFDLQDAADADEIPLILGVARLRDQVEPDALRADAVNALSSAMSKESRIAFV